MQFLSPSVLWLLLLVPALLAGYVLMQRRRSRYALRFASLSMVKEAIGKGPGWRRHAPPAFFLMAIAVMIAAMARPQAEVRMPSQEGTVILAIDVSVSMLAEDINPDRLRAAQAAALEFVAVQPPNVRVGVVAYGGTAALVQAPTVDRDQVKRAVLALTPQRGTAIGRGLMTSLIAIFGTSDGPPSIAGRELVLAQLPPITEPVAAGSYDSAVIVLMSDGQNNTGPAPLEVVPEASNRGVRVYTVGLGSAEGTVIRFQGRASRVFLDEPTLRQIAVATGGQYFRASSETDLSDVYRNLGTKLVFKTEKTELTAGFTAAAAVLMLAAGALSLAWFNRLP